MVLYYIKIPGMIVNDSANRDAMHSSKQIFVWVITDFSDIFTMRGEFVCFWILHQLAVPLSHVVSEVVCSQNHVKAEIYRVSL